MHYEYFELGELSIKGNDGLAVTEPEKRDGVNNTPDPGRRQNLFHPLNPPRPMHLDLKFARTNIQVPHALPSSRISRSA